MESLTPLAKAILETLEPDPAKQEQWLIHAPLFPPGKNPEMEAFKDAIDDVKQIGGKVFVAGDYDCGATRFRER